MSSYVLGLDGGQSSTICVLGRLDGTLVGAGRGGPCNHVHQPGGAERMRRALTSAVGEALLAAAPPPERLTAAYLSLTGGQQLAQEILPTIVPVERLVAESDVVAALAGGIVGAPPTARVRRRRSNSVAPRDGPGVALIAGTGAVALAVNAAGERVVRGGWGYLLGDEGSGYWIGMQCLRAAARAEDGRTPSGGVLRDEVLRHYGAADVRAVAARVYGGEIDRPEVARLAPIALTAADAGDPLAERIVQEAAEELAALVEATCAAADFAEDDDLVIVATGGVLRPGNALWRRFARCIAERLPAYRLVAPSFPPIIGAFLLSLRLAGVEVDEAVLDRVRATMADLPGIASKTMVG